MMAGASATPATRTDNAAALSTASTIPRRQVGGPSPSATRSATQTSTQNSGSDSGDTVAYCVSSASGTIAAVAIPATAPNRRDTHTPAVTPKAATSSVVRSLNTGECVPKTATNGASTSGQPGGCTGGPTRFIGV